MHRDQMHELGRGSFGEALDEPSDRLAEFVAAAVLGVAEGPLKVVREGGIRGGAHAPIVAIPAEEREHPLYSHTAWRPLRV